MNRQPGANRRRMRRAGLALACCLWLGGCAGLWGFSGDANDGPPFRDTSLSMPAARDAVAVGQATKADVAAALGPAAVVRFHSGFEIWAYRGRVSPSSAVPAELVILFAPSGVVRKTRIRLDAPSRPPAPA